MKILTLIPNATCGFCEKQKDEICEVELENGRKARLCWPDLQKMVRMNLKETDDASRKASS